MGTYDFRRPLTSGERNRLIGAAVGAALATGAAAFYLGRTVVQRHPLDRPDRSKASPGESS